jgi:hypothetical protein
MLNAIYVNQLHQWVQDSATLGLFFDIHFHFFKENDLGLLLTYFKRIGISRHITILHKVILNFGMMYNITFLLNAAFNLQVVSFVSLVESWFLIDLTGK